MDFFNKNTVLFGLISGLLTPLLGYGILQGLFWILSQFVNSEYGDWRFRTIALLAICFNLIPFNYHKNKRNEDSMRGVIIPTVIFAATWAFTFRAYIFGES